MIIFQYFFVVVKVVDNLFRLSQKKKTERERERKIYTVKINVSKTSNSIN